MGWRAADEFWAICWPGDGEEIGITPYECPEPWDCHCIRAEREGGPKQRCGITLEAARAEVVKHYSNKAEYFATIHLDEFAQWMGYYDDEPASGTEARSGETAKTGSTEGDGPTAESGTPKTTSQGGRGEQSSR
jgi:hypothetical protein